MSELLSNLPHSKNWVCAYLPINAEEFNIRTLLKRGKACGTKSCEEVLNGFASRGTRIIHNEYHFVVPYPEWSKLCRSCRRSIHQMYYTDLYHSYSEEVLPFELFEIEIEKEATIDLWQYLSHMMHFSRDDAVREELEKTLDIDVRGLLEDISQKYREKERELGFEQNGSGN